jgi:hypothetical protein
MLKNFFTKEYKNTLLSNHQSFCEIQLDLDFTKIKYNRISFINLAIYKILREKNLKIEQLNYLEIGCYDDACFSSVPIVNKIGVDPVQGGTIKTTSDLFFLNNELLFDIIFIDGLHEYEQVRNDVSNSLSCLKEGGYLFIHDMIPRNFAEENVPRLQDIWTGDVWKVGCELMETKNIDFFVIKADHGIGVVKKKGLVQLNNKIADLKDLRFKDFLPLSNKINYLSVEDSISVLK